jgi:hypothetical protein
VVIALAFSLLIYQYELTQSIKRLQISYDFSNFSEDATGEIQLKQSSSPPNLITNLNNDTNLIGNITQVPILNQGVGLEPFFQYFFSYLDNSTENINLTAATESVMQNDTLINQIEASIPTVISFAQQIYDAYLNGSLSWDLMIQFFQQMWMNAFTSQIPPKWFKPAFIYITNGGWIAIENVSIDGNFLWNNNTTPFTKIENQALEPKKNITIEISIAEMIRSIGRLAFDKLVNITMALLLVNPQGIIETFTTYFETLIYTMSLKLSVQFSAILGLFPVSLDMELDLTKILQNLNPRFVNTNNTIVNV